ncbi:GGDEF domain-containing protein [Marinomonas mediterranea]|jgi:diguanylate cyclase|uniref:diguanylate cyclase n=1 Tax=Marinomonas mediterranea (strain ATCC 700492 / JCM 21426 / NBRC 103028 / MMB-1) TaxID=717774 RepID=F2JVA4_MARM1|nr:diguanylate cyclase [Marinomonas mediterranea]ADZ92862.1 diguanylate cyclase [Marinomonas mediterranea MMB-1]WCN10795.1 diguanylate cyclase [Marinomonas mediterranea]WCN14852.1 diguanylate cyclase [Marinomonas mediterranea]WCN18884.1 diguanylate cyclase [Marinomonas mediterranea MMB-1]
MSTESSELAELHWLFDMLQHIDVGLVVLDSQYQVSLWNGFMENHSGKSSTTAKGKSLFELFPDINADWLKKKVDTVLALNTPIYIAWEQRPYVFKFKPYRSITGTSEHMYQNVVLRPITDVRGNVSHVCVVVYDVTPVAMNKLSLVEANRKLDQMSKTDGLTDLNNRANLDRALGMIFSSYTKNKGTHCLVMADIDHFKKVNDTYGHPVGDEVLKDVAKILGGSSRRGDFVGRFGGEEFAILLPNTGKEGAFKYCEKIRETIAKRDIKTAQGSINITISLGVCELSDAEKDVSAWLSKADDALYRAKSEGRNKTCTA